MRKPDSIAGTIFVVRRTLTKGLCSSYGYKPSSIVELALAHYSFLFILTDFRNRLAVARVLLLSTNS